MTDVNLFQEKVFANVRVSKLRLFAEYLCGIDRPLMTYNVERSCYASAVSAAPVAMAGSEEQQTDVTALLSDMDTKVVCIIIIIIIIIFALGSKDPKG